MSSTAAHTRPRLTLLPPCPRWSNARRSQDTVARSPAIVAETPGASEESTFVAEQLAPLYPESPRHGATAVRIVNSDSFTAARKMAGASGAQDSIAVLNLASDMLPGGGWYDTLCRTQVRGRTALHVCDL
jgi:hypothetical protein